MTPRRKSTSTDGSSPAGTARLRRSRPADITTRRWRRHARLDAVRSAISATEGIRWNSRLVRATLEELYVDDHFEELLERKPGDLRPRHYPRAIAVALILRHSWHPDDLAWILKRLNLSRGDV